jgi:hypothetical protein
MSMRRAAWQAREVIAAPRADDLRCFDGVNAALRTLPADEVLLADPVTGYGAQALAPTWIIGDFKVWNGSTDSDRIRRRIQLLDAAFDSGPGERVRGALAALSSEYDAHWLLVSRHEVEPPLGSELDPYDARGLRDLLDSGEIGATRVAAGGGRFDAAADEEDVEACDLELWKLSGAEREHASMQHGGHA